MPESAIDLMYEASFVPEKWPALLDALSTQVDALGGCLFAVNNASAAWVSSASLTQTMHIFVTDGWIGASTRAIRAAKLNHNGFLTDLDVCTREEIENDPFYRDFLHKHGVGWAVGTHIPLFTGDVVSVTFERRRERGPVERRFVEALDRVRPHLARSAMISARLGLAQAVTAANAMAALGLPAATLSGSGRVMACNALCEPLLGGVLLDRRDRIHFADANADRLLTQGILAMHASTSSARPVQSIPLPAPNAMDAMVAHLIPFRGGAQDLFARMASMLVLMPVSRKGDLSVNLIQGLFDLTPAEAKVAAGIGAGSSPAEIAARLGLSVETVRAHLKAVFAKTGVHKQGTLAALLRGVGLPRA